jgi:hypothetical protein
MRRLHIALGLFAFASGAAPGGDSGNLVSPLKDQHAINGCAWTATSPQLGPGLVFLAELDESKVLMRIDGTDRVLAAVGPQRRSSLDKVGSTLTRTYGAEGISVTATYTVTWVCPQGDEACEVTKYDVILAVSLGGRTQIVKGSGAVGC